jgi:hypothetical protein
MPSKPKPTIVLSQTRARQIMKEFPRTNASTKLPNANGTVALESGLSLRKLPESQRQGKDKTKAEAFRLYGTVEMLRKVSRLPQFITKLTLTYSTNDAE